MNTFIFQKKFLHPSGLFLYETIGENEKGHKIYNNVIIQKDLYSPNGEIKFKKGHYLKILYISMSFYFMNEEENFIEDCSIEI